MRSVTFAILYVGLLLAGLAMPAGAYWRTTIAGMCGMAFCLGVLFAVLGW
jgi:hypothetical protein